MADPGEAPDPLEADAWLPVDLVRGQSAEAGETLPEQIADRIAGLIGSGTLRPGARLPSERELARIFGVSRLAVREAAHRLEARGLVVVRRGAGSFVATPAATMPDPAEAQVPPTVDLEDLSDVRMLLEPAAADWAARRGDRASLAVLLRIAEQFEAAADSAEPRFDLLAESDVQLHLEIAHCADNALLVQLIEQLLDLHRLRLEWSLRRPGRLEEIAVEHRRLVDAITAADPLAARDAMLAHLAASAASFRTLAAGDAPLD
jgi:GntR family transcriptional repressor for pyruvate dehydrogenase complex